MAKHNKHKTRKPDREPKSGTKKQKVDKAAIKNKDKKKAAIKSKKGKSKVKVVKEPQPSKIPSEERLKMIRTAAHTLAQKRRQPGDSEMDDRIKEQQEIDAAIIGSDD